MEKTKYSFPIPPNKYEGIYSEDIAIHFLNYIAQELSSNYYVEARHHEQGMSDGYGGTSTIDCLEIRPPKHGFWRFGGWLAAAYLGLDNIHYLSDRLGEIFMQHRDGYMDSFKHKLVYGRPVALHRNKFWSGNERLDNPEDIDRLLGRARL